MKRVLMFVAFCVEIFSLIHPVAQAGLLFETNLTGSQEVPANTSIATGFASVFLNDTADLITVNMSWVNMSWSPTAAHIHGLALPGFNASPIFTFDVTGLGLSGTMLKYGFAITPSQVADRKAGLYYVNIHNIVFPSGEIRGQLPAIPEPTMLSLMTLGGLRSCYAIRVAKRLQVQAPQVLREALHPLE